MLCDSGPFCMVFNFFVVRLMALFYWKCTAVHAVQQVCFLAEKPLPCNGLWSGMPWIISTAPLPTQQDSDWTMFSVLTLIRQYLLILLDSWFKRWQIPSHIHSWPHLQQAFFLLTNLHYTCMTQLPVLNMQLWKQYASRYYVWALYYCLIMWQYQEVPTFFSRIHLVV